MFLKLGLDVVRLENFPAKTINKLYIDGMTKPFNIYYVLSKLENE